MKKHFLNFLIKPASGLCNMRCKYCFYQDELQNREAPGSSIMDSSITKSLIRQAFDTIIPGGNISFIFQGGEPTLAGIQYFEHFIQEVKKANTCNVKVNYSIQTNGLSLSTDWYELFDREHFLVGVSLDGDKSLHNMLRPDAGNHDTWNRIYNNCLTLKEYNVDFNILCVITRQCAKHPRKVYRTLKSISPYLQFIPCLDPMEAVRGSMPHSLTPELYGSFLCGIFDEWYLDWKNNNFVSVRLFDDYLRLAMGYPAGTCATSGQCGSYFTVDGDGSVYPCDFYCLDQWNIGNIQNNTLLDMESSETQQCFILEGKQQPSECASCRWQRLCNGGCKRDYTYDQNAIHNYFCPAFKTFFSYAETRLVEIIQTERRNRQHMIRPN